ncbi:MAG: hypothetical protein KGH87_00670 [Thaumarchaeota archaeon]|nr:hypothetical protein [Candidatus Nitrosotalea sp.]MDE1813240.1 hypothetical protein [Nitrososphaerota archaeon]MDE1838409.1 hypothetical protein [Nitrososphaerota archaeon]
MNTLHLSIITLLLVILGTNLSYEQYSVTGPFQGFITVKTNRATYDYGNTITIEGNAIKYGTIKMQIFDSNNQPIIHDAIEPRSGHYSGSYLISGPLWKSKGTYTVTVQQDSFSYERTIFYFTGNGKPGDITGLPSPQNPPLIITQVEFYGPWTHHEHSCIGDGDAFANQWFDLYNPTSYEIQIKGYALGIKEHSEFGGTEISNEEWIDLQPHQRCTFALPWVEQASIPDPRNVIISFGYNYSTNTYKITTPPLTDTYNDSRTWSLVDNNWNFSAPSPLKQISSMIKPDDVTCNNNLKLMMYQNKTVCISPDHVAKMSLHGWKPYEKPEYIPVLNRVYSSGPGFGCPFIFPNATIVNSTGFETYNYSGITHYILKPKQSGSFTYNIYSDSYNLDPPILSPSKINVTNGADIYFQPDARHEMKQDANSTIMIWFNQKSEIINRDQYVTVVAKISTNENIPKGTYWLNFVPGGCSQLPPMPIVIGNKTDATDIG